MTVRAQITLGSLSPGQQYGKAVLPYNWEAMLEIVSISDTGDGDNYKLIEYTPIESEHYGAYDGGTAFLWTGDSANKCTFSAIPTTLILSGYVKDNDNEGIVGVVVSTIDGSGETDISGYWWLVILCPFTGILTPAKNGYTFNPETIILSNRYWNVSNNNFVGTLALPGKPINPIPASGAENIRLSWPTLVWESGS